MCALKQCHGKENCLNISSILSCEDVAKCDGETDKSVSVLRHDAYTSARFIGTSHSNVIYNN